MNLKKVVGSTSLLLPLAVGAAELSWEQLLERSKARLLEAQRVLMDEHQAGDYDSFEISGRRRELVLSTAGVPGLVGQVVYVGSFSRRDSTWLWGWADPEVPLHLSAPLRIVRQLGKARAFELLTQQRWEGDIGDAQNMVAIANDLLNGKGMYRIPEEDTGSYMYWVFTDIRPARR